MSESADYDKYFQHLLGRSGRGDWYRRHWLYPRIGKRLNGRTLDLGCGIGDMLRFRPGTVGVDVNPETVEFCRKQGLPAQRMKPDHLPFGDASFDCVLMDNVLEHIAEPGPVLREVGRVLGQGGRLVVGVPGQRGWDSDADHKVFYDEPGLKRLLESHGFALGEFFYTPLWRSAVLARRLRQYCLYGVFKRSPATVAPQ